MNNNILELLYKIKKEESLSKENEVELNKIIRALETKSDINDIKEILVVFLRIFLSHFNPDDWK